jgi:hypothetical protein
LAQRERCVGGMPPASQSHLEPTGCETPTSTAALSLDRPAAITAQNRRRSSGSATPGRPGALIAALPSRSAAHFRLAMPTPFKKVLQRQVEIAAAVLIAMVNQPHTFPRTPIVDSLLDGIENGRPSRRHRFKPDGRRHGPTC